MKKLLTLALTTTCLANPLFASDAGKENIPPAYSSFSQDGDDEVYKPIFNFQEEEELQEKLAASAAKPAAEPLPAIAIRKLPGDLKCFEPEVVLRHNAAAKPMKKNLKTVDLRYTGITKEDLKDLAATLPDTLTELYIGSNYFKADDIAQLVTYKPKHLEILDFSHSELLDAGVIAIPKHLLVNLKKLNLTRNRITYVGVESLLSKLPAGQEIELDLYDNDIKENGRLALINAGFIETELHSGVWKRERSAKKQRV